MLIVADGVGGWNEVGVDPALYSKRLCELLRDLYLSNDLKKNMNPHKMRKGVEGDHFKNFIKFLINQSVRSNKEVGSSTLCLILLDRQHNYLYSGNIGDSCYLIARPEGIGNFKLVLKSEEQQHQFNVPYQIGKGGDNPNCAQVMKHKVQGDDFIVLATDGLWDNMDADAVLKELNNYSKFHNTIRINSKDFANLIALKANKLSLDPNFASPFSKKAIENKLRFFGGKPDDITVVASQIADETETMTKSSVSENFNETSASLSDGDTYSVDKSNSKN